MVAPLLLMLAATSQSVLVPVTGDVVRVRDVALASGKGQLAILKLGKRAVTLTPGELRRLVANRLPGGRFTLRHSGDVRFVPGAAPSPRPARVHVVANSGVLAGRDMVLRTAIGAVVIERKVVTLQPARAGKRVFVRTDDGAVVAARVAAGEETR